jgi:HlyD family secretion protein
VSIIVGEAKGVLRVSNAALRFTPNLSPEELAKMAQEMRDRMMAQRQAQGGQPGAAAPGGAAPSVIGGQGMPRGEGQEGPAMASRQGGMPGGAEGQTGRVRQQAPRVWLLDKDGKLKMSFLRTGVSDTSYSEILRGELKEGDLVITGTETPANRAAANQPQMNQMMFMGGGRR